jgi:hypothetical protein
VYTTKVTVFFYDAELLEIRYKIPGFLTNFSIESVKLSLAFI